MADKKRGEIKGITGLIIIILIGAILILLFYKYTRPEFGEETMSFAMGLSSAEASFPYIGNMDTQIYYRNTDARVKDIPVDKRVYFADEKTAKQYNYTLSP